MPRLYRARDESGLSRTISSSGGLRAQLNAFESCVRGALLQEYREVFLVVAGLCLRYDNGFRETVRRIQGGEIGEVVTIYGVDGKHSHPANQVARGIGTVTSDLLCAVSARVPRLYVS